MSQRQAGRARKRASSREVWIWGRQSKAYALLSSWGSEGPATGGGDEPILTVAHTEGKKPEIRRGTRKNGERARGRRVVRPPRIWQVSGVVYLLGNKSNSAPRTTPPSHTPPILCAQISASRYRSTHPKTDNGLQLFPCPRARKKDPGRARSRVERLDQRPDDCERTVPWRIPIVIVEG